MVKQSIKIFELIVLMFYNVEALAKAGNIRTNVQLPTNAQ